MTMPRSDRVPWWHRWPRRSGVDALLTDAAPPLAPEMAAIGMSDPFTLPPTHPWREVPCVICRTVASWRTLRILTIADSRLPSRAYWRVVAGTYLVCTDHDQLPSQSIYAAVHRLESPGCPCHSRSATAAASYPYHLSGALS